MNTQKLVSILCVSLSLVACAPIPNFGPSDESIRDGATLVSEPLAAQKEEVSYQLIEVNAGTIAQYGKRVKSRFRNDFVNVRPDTKEPTIQIGDRLTVHIRETSDDGLFATAGKRDEILSLVVEKDGKISSPFAGEIEAAGLSLSTLQQRLNSIYSRKAVAPDVQLSIAESASQRFVVLGNVGSPGTQDIPPQGIKLLQALALSSGTQNPPWEVYVSVRRGSRLSKARLDDILSDSKQNLLLQSNDIVQVTHEPRFFSVFGAVSQPGNTQVANQRATLSLILGLVGGLDDESAEPGSVFVYRPQSKPLPTIFSLDFRSPDAFFLAEGFELTERDIIYVANADGRELEKFLRILVSPLVALAQ